MKFPNECIRCGMCCLSERCFIITELFNIEKKGKCPKLYFIDDIANCSLFDMIEEDERESARKVFGIGAGCCIEARVYKDGVEYDFASLPKEKKLLAVKQIRRK